VVDGWCWFFIGCVYWCCRVVGALVGV